MSSKTSWTKPLVELVWWCGVCAAIAYTADQAFVGTPVPPPPPVPEEIESITQAPSQPSD